MNAALIQSLAKKARNMDEVELFENRRCAAIETCDAQLLMSFLDPAYIHIHSSGRIEDRDSYVTNAVKQPRRLVRSEERFHSFGDTVLIVGFMSNKLADGRVIEGISQRVAVRRPSGWVLASSQLTPATR